MIQPPIFDVSGADGPPGASGKDFDDSTALPGQRAKRGGRGNRGERGESAGTISVRLTTPTTTENIPKTMVLANPIDADVRLNASLNCADGQLQKRNTILNIKVGESMCFSALGGNGGQGGNGGNGQNGAKGSKYGIFLILH